MHDILRMLILYVIKRANITDSHRYKSQHIGQRLAYSELLERTFSHICLNPLPFATAIYPKNLNNYEIQTPLSNLTRTVTPSADVFAQTRA